jgi:hypothetical protein
MLMKDDSEHPVPEPLRTTIRQIANAFVAGDFQLREHPIAGVRPVDPDTAEWMADNIAAYGDTLATLNEETWTRSVYRWMEGYWDMLVDLTTSSEPVSDLTLHAKLFEAGKDFELEIYGVYVLYLTPNSDRPLSTRCGHSPGQGDFLGATGCSDSPAAIPTSICWPPSRMAVNGVPQPCCLNAAFSSAGRT